MPESSWDTFCEALKSAKSKDVLDIATRSQLIDIILRIREFSNLFKQMGGDTTTFDECLTCLNYVRIPKNTFLHQAGCKKDLYSFLLQGSCGIFVHKNEAKLQLETKQQMHLQELSEQQTRFEARIVQGFANSEEEYECKQSLKKLLEKKQATSASIQSAAKECDALRIKEAIETFVNIGSSACSEGNHILNNNNSNASSISTHSIDPCTPTARGSIAGSEEKKQRCRMMYKYFSLNQICLWTKERTMQSGDTIDEINLRYTHSREAKHTVITLEECHLLQISMADFARLFTHILSQITVGQRILRSYFSDIPEEIVQQLSLDFHTKYFSNNEVIYAEGQQNTNEFYVLLAGSIEIRKSHLQPQSTNSSLPAAVTAPTTVGIPVVNTPATTSSLAQGVSQQQQQSSSSSATSSQMQATTQSSSTAAAILSTAKKTPMLQFSLPYTRGTSAIVANSPDNFHSIILISERQIFGTECHNAGINEFSAVSTSTETKILVMDMRKFDHFEHSFDFKGFFTKQAQIQLKFYLARLQKLKSFEEKKRADMHNFKRELSMRTTMLKERNERIEANNNNNNNRYDEQEIEFGSANRLDNDVPTATSTGPTSSNSLIAASGGSQQKFVQRNSGTSLPRMDRNSSNTLNSNKQNATMFTARVAVKKKQQIEGNSIDQNTSTAAPAEIGRQNGFEFEKNNEKARRNIILIEHKVSKQLNNRVIEHSSVLKKATGGNTATLSAGKESTQNQQSNSYKENNYVQREGKLPWLDQFGRRKEMDANSKNVGGVVQDLSQIRFKKMASSIIQDDISTGAAGQQQQSMTSSNQQPLQLATIDEAEQQQIAESLAKASPKKRSSVNLQFVAKRIQKIKDKLNLTSMKDLNNNNNNSTLNASTTNYLSTSMSCDTLPWISPLQKSKQLQQQQQSQQQHQQQYQQYSTNIFQSAGVGLNLNNYSLSTKASKKRIDLSINDSKEIVSTESSSTPYIEGSLKLISDKPVNSQSQRLMMSATMTKISTDTVQSSPLIMMQSPMSPVMPKSSKFIQPLKSPQELSKNQCYFFTSAAAAAAAAANSNSSRNIIKNSFIKGNAIQFTGEQVQQQQKKYSQILPKGSATGMLSTILGANKRNQVTQTNESQIQQALFFTMNNKAHLNQSPSIDINVSDSQQELYLMKSKTSRMLGGLKPNLSTNSMQG